MIYRLIQTIPLHPGVPASTCTETAPEDATEAEAVAYFESTRLLLGEQGIRMGTLTLESEDGAAGVRVLRRAELESEPCG